MGLRDIFSTHRMRRVDVGQRILDLPDRLANMGLAKVSKES